MDGVLKYVEMMKKNEPYISRFMDIPAGVVAAGNPCKVIRKITDADRLVK